MAGIHATPRYYPILSKEGHAWRPEDTSLPAMQASQNQGELPWS